jgi:hypothetical protein
MQGRLVVPAGLVLAVIGPGFGVASATPVPRGAFSPPTVVMAYYDDHLDAIVSTDTSSRAEAKALHINYSPTLGALKVKLFPEIYTIEGAAAPGQLMVLGSEPGETNYSPLWHEVTVRWNEGVTPVLLTSDTQIDQEEGAGNLTEKPSDVLLNCPVIAEDVAQGTTVAPPTVFRTFYDGHKDGMLATDVSTKPQAKAEDINYSPILAKLDSEVFPEIYIVRGAAAKGQLMVLGSGPGEPDYSPLWRETIVRWKRGVTPTLIKSDTKVDALLAAGKISEREKTVILNCPVTGER